MSQDLKINLQNAAFNLLEHSIVHNQLQKQAGYRACKLVWFFTVKKLLGW